MEKDREGAGCDYVWGACGGTGITAGGKESLGLCAHQGGGADGLQWGDVLGHEGGLLLDDGIIDRGAETFVEDFDPEQLATGGAVLVGGGHGDVEGQDLIAVPGQGG